MTLGIVSASLALIVTSLWPDNDSLPRTRNLTVLSALENSLLNVVLLAPSPLPVHTIFILTRTSFNHVCLYSIPFFKKVLAALVSSLSKIVTGTTTASSALVATLLWSAKDSSPMEPISFAQSALNNAFFKFSNQLSSSLFFLKSSRRNFGRGREVGWFVFFKGLIEPMTKI